MGQDPEVTVDLNGPISHLGLPDEITIALALATDPPASIGDLLTLARENVLGEIKGIGPARKRAIEQSLRRAGQDPGDRPGPQFVLPGRAP